MNAILFGWLWMLGRTTLLVALSALVVAAVLRLVRPRSPRVHRAAWCMVLLVGWLFVPMPVEVPWYEPADDSGATVARANDSQSEGDGVLASESAAIVELAPRHGAPAHIDDSANIDDSADIPVIAELTVPANDDGTIELAGGQAGRIPPTDLSDEPSLVPVESSRAATMSPAVLADGPSAAIASPLADAVEPSPASGILSRVSWQGILFALWLAGMVVVVLRWLAGYVRSLRAMSTALRPDEASCRQWRELLAGQGVEREIPLRLTEGMGPLLCRWPDGYELVVPAELWGSLGESARLGIMRHELAHYQRGDVWKSLAVRLLALPHWFNPAAWLAARRFEEAAEWACDEAAVAGHAPQTEYARTLLALAEASLGGGSCHPSMSRWNLSARVRRLLADSNAKDSIMKKLILTGLAAVLVAFCLVRIDLVAKPPATASGDVTRPPSAVDESVVQTPLAEAKVGNDDPKPSDTARQTDAKETTSPTRRTLHYGGKTFDEWKQLVAKGVDQKQALSLVATFTAFGSRGYGREATEQILLLIRQHGPDPNKPESSPPMGMGGPMGPMMGPGGMAMGPAGPMGPMGPMGESPESQLSKELIDRARTAFIDGFGPGYGVIPRKESLPVLYRELREGNGTSILFVLGLLDRIGERSSEATAAVARLARSERNADARDMAFLVLIKLDPSGDVTADFLNELVENNRELPSLPASFFFGKATRSTNIAGTVVAVELMPGYRGVLRVVQRCLDHDKPGVRDWAIRHVADFLRDFHAENANAPMSAEDAKLVQRLMNRLILAYAETDLKVRPEILARLDSRSSTRGGLRSSTPAFNQIYSLIKSATKSTDANLRRAADELLRDLGPRSEPGSPMGGPGMMGGGMGGPMVGPAGGMGPGVGGGMPGMGRAPIEAPLAAESASEAAAKAFVAALADGEIDNALVMLSKDFKESKRRELPALAGGMDFSKAKLVKSAQADKVFRAGFGPVAVKANKQRFWLCLTLHETKREGDASWTIADADFVEREDSMSRHVETSVETPLRVSIRTAARLRVGIGSRFTIQLTNLASTTFTNVEVDVRYDECLRPILASPGNTKRDGSLVWKIDSLGPMETVVYQFLSENIRAAERAQCSVKVNSEEGVEVSDSCSFPIEGPVRDAWEVDAD